MHRYLPRWVRLRKRYLIAYPLPSWHLVCGWLYLLTLQQWDVWKHHWLDLPLLLWLLRIRPTWLRVQ